MILSVSEQIKTSHFIFLMAKRGRKMIKTHLGSQSSQSDDKNYDKNHHVKGIEMEKQKIPIFKLMHENECEDGKATTSKAKEDRHYIKQLVINQN